MIERIKIYLESRKGACRDDDLCRIYILKIEHLYYKVSKWRRTLTLKDISLHL